MELRGSFLPQFKVRETQLAFLPSTKCNSLRVIGMFTGESFPAQYDRWKNLEVHCDNDESIRYSAVPKINGSKQRGLYFNRLQVTEEECAGCHRRDFGRFVAREAILDEEYWTAAWLRAEAHWESSPRIRHVHNQNSKIKYAEEEFHALKLRCSRPVGKILNCICFVAVRKEDKNVRRTVVKSIVGTLDLSIRRLGQGETYPGEIKRVSAVSAKPEPFRTDKFAYIANVVVAKWARRQGIALNMLYLAVDVAKMTGMKQLFVHVYADNKPAQDLYKKVGFKVVKASVPSTLQDYRMLLSMDL